MLTLVVSLVLCSQCVGNSEGLANLDNSQQRIGGSKRNSEDLVNAKLHQQNAEDSGQSMEKLLEVVEVKIFQNRPVESKSLNVGKSLKIGKNRIKSEKSEFIFFIRLF